MARVSIIGLVGKSMFFDVPHFHSGGETITATGYYEEWGGKGFNQAVAAARQGAAVSFLGACSIEDMAPIEALCCKEGIEARLCAKERSTARAAILTDGTGETRVTVYPGAELEASEVVGFADLIVTADYLLLNNEVPEAVNLSAVEIAQKNNVKVIYNPAPERFLPEKILESVTIFTPNEFEEMALLRHFPQITRRSSLLPEIVTTLGSAGCRIHSTGEIIPAPSVKAVDSTGAGDTFNAVLACRLAEGEDLRVACIEANAAAARSVEVRRVLPSLPGRV